MKILKVEFARLFGFFNYSIDFHDTVTIVHGPNGCGKTTMLKIIDAVFNKKAEVIKSTDFKSVQFYFSEGSFLEVERKQVNMALKGERIGGITYLVYTVIADGQKYVFDSFESGEEYQMMIEKVLNSYRPLPYLERTSTGTWNDRRHGEILTTEEVITRYGPAIITPELEHRKSGYVERKRRPYQGNVVRIA